MKDTKSDSIIVEGSNSKHIEIKELLNLLPLEPQYPMQLSSVNRERIMGQSAIEQEAIRNKKILAERTFPLFLFLILLLTPFVWFLWKYLEPTFRDSYAEKQKSAEEIALNKLQDLEDKEYPAKGDFKKFYTKLAEIIRHYLEKKYQIPATKQTTEQFLNTFENDIGENKKQALNRILELSDRVKFANYSSTNSECQQAIHDAKIVIS